MKVFYSNEWREFYPIRRPVVGKEELDTRPYESLDDEVFGKLIMAIVGYQPVWMYKTVKKSEIRQ